MQPSLQLNPSQSQAVEIVSGPLLILAGAGSGKTRVLTHRIVELITGGHAFPGEIFAVTFTNKAAKEMKERVEMLLGNNSIPADNLWISTFHSSGSRILRDHGEKIGLSSGFTILDNYDQQSLIKDCMRRLEVSEKVINPKAVLSKLNALKNEAIDPRTFTAPKHSYFESKIAPILKMYEEELLKNNSVDFGDLLLKSYFILRDHPDILDNYQERFRFILVDEYQDTNIVQYKFLKLLASKYRNLCVVGDEDQSIYKWRGADIKNILDFEKDYPEANVIKLEENYRSTGHIIRAANQVISNNTQRKSKVLFTSNQDGDQVEVHILGSDLDEARWVTKKIKTLVDSGTALSEVAILYRTHAQSRILEDSLRYEKIPYRIYGGLKFYERAEIKDALAFLRIIVNPKDDISLYRIINVPARGIGKQSIEELRDFANKEQLTALEAIGIICKDPNVDFKPATKKKLAGFLETYARLQQKLGEYSIAEFYAWMLDDLGYVKELEKENSIESASRIENLKELASAISEFESQHPSANLENFLQEISLVTDQDKNTDSAETVTLMTMHSAKGLEFLVVFLVGMEEGLFPSAKSDASEGADSDGAEEERRLCYVGMTRAREKLFLSASRLRRVFGVTQVQQNSRFINELPRGEIVICDHSPRVERPSWNSSWNKHSGDDWDYSQEESLSWKKAGKVSFQGDTEYSQVSPSDGPSPVEDGYDIGKTVRHPSYGEGVIVKREGQMEGLKLSVRFSGVGVKKFIARFAPLEVVS